MPSYLKDDVDQFFECEVHVPSRTIYMGGECNEEQAAFFLKGITVLRNKNDQPITIIMNNPGGDEYHGMAIYDAIATCTQHVTIIAYGHAMSMGSWILQAADERILAPRCTVMIHYGSWWSDDHVKYFRVHAKEGERLNAMMEADYMQRIKEKNPDFPLRKLRKMLEDEVYMTPEEAIDLGLADKILS